MIASEIASIQFTVSGKRASSSYNRTRPSQNSGANSPARAAAQDVAVESNRDARDQGAVPGSVLRLDRRTPGGERSPRLHPVLLRAPGARRGRRSLIRPTTGGASSARFADLDLAEILELIELGALERGDRDGVDRGDLVEFGEAVDRIGVAAEAGERDPSGGADVASSRPRRRARWRAPAASLIDSSPGWPRGRRTIRSSTSKTVDRPLLAAPPARRAAMRSPGSGKRSPSIASKKPGRGERPRSRSRPRRPTGPGLAGALGVAREALAEEVEVVGVGEDDDRLLVAPVEHGEALRRERQSTHDHPSVQGEAEDQLGVEVLDQLAALL